MKKNFTFIVDEVEYQTSRIIADILSPRIRHFHFIDETINQFYIDTNISGNNTNDFNKVLSLISFQKENLNENEVQYFNQIFYALGNENLFKKIQLKDEITIKNVFKIIQNKENFLNTVTFGITKEAAAKNTADVNFINNIGEELKFISSHFYEIDKKELKKLSTKNIRQTIRQENVN